MNCIICEDWSIPTVECEFCDNAVCEDCIIEGTFEEEYCSEDCRDANDSR